MSPATSQASACIGPQDSETSQHTINRSRQFHSRARQSSTPLRRRQSSMPPRRRIATAVSLRQSRPYSIVLGGDRTPRGGDRGSARRRSRPRAAATAAPHVGDRGPTLWRPRPRAAATAPPRGGDRGQEPARRRGRGKHGRRGIWAGRGEGIAEHGASACAGKITQIVR